MTDIPKFPVSEVANLRKATTDELVTEIINLRLSVGELFMSFKDFKANAQMPDSAVHRLDDQDETILNIRAYVNTLSDKIEKVDGRMSFQVDRITRIEGVVDDLTDNERIELP